MNNNFCSIDLKEDYTFKYVFGKDAPLNRCALKSLIEDFTGFTVNNLHVLSPELKCGSAFEKNTFFDIYAKFNEGYAIDLEMQMINKKDIFHPRSLFYLSKILNAQLTSGDDYSNLKKCIVLLFLNFKIHYDKKLVHDFGIFDEDGTPYSEEKRYVHIITVELPKIAKVNPITDQEKWAYVLKYFGDKTKADLINQLMNEKEGIYMALDAANKISQNELEWFNEWKKEQARLEEGSSEAGVKTKIQYEAREEGLEEGHKEGRKEQLDSLIRNAYTKGKSLELIKEMFEVDDEYIQSVINK